MATVQRRRLLLDNARPIVYLLGPFRFATDQAAPLTSPYTEAGAVGGLTIADTGNNLSVTGGVVRVAGGVTANNPRAVATAAPARVAGRAALCRAVKTNGAGQFAGGWSSVTTPDNLAIWYYNGTGVSVIENNGSVLGPFATLASGTSYAFAVVLRAGGAFYLVKGGAFATWTLLWVGVAGTAAGFPFMAQGGTAGLGDWDDLRVTDLGGAWASDTGIATTYKATTVDGDTATQTPNAVVYHTITAQTGVTQELKFRITDASNYWLLRMAAPGTNTIKIIEVVAAVETERASAAQTFTNAVAYRVGVTMDGAALASYVDNTAKGSYASAATGLAAGGVSVSHAGTKLECWPRNPAMPSGV